MEQQPYKQIYTDIQYRRYFDNYPNDYERLKSVLLNPTTRIDYLKFDLTDWGLELPTAMIIQNFIKSNRYLKCVEIYVPHENNNGFQLALSCLRAVSENPSLSSGMDDLRTVTRNHRRRSPLTLSLPVPDFIDYQTIQTCDNYNQLFAAIREVNKATNLTLRISNGLNQVHIAPEHILSISTGISSLQNVTELSLEGPATHTVSEMFASMVKTKMPSLRRLSLLLLPGFSLANSNVGSFLADREACFLNYLSINYRRGQLTAVSLHTDADLEALATALSGNKTISQLYITFSHLDRDASETFFRRCVELNSLSNVIDLTFNFRSKNAPNVLSMMIHNKLPLKVLEMESSLNSADSRILIKDLLTKTTSLQHFKLGLCRTNIASLQPLSEGLRSNTTLTSLSLKIDVSYLVDDPPVDISSVIAVVNSSNVTRLEIKVGRLYNSFPLDIAAMLRNSSCKLKELRIMRTVIIQGAETMLIISAASDCPTLKELELEPWDLRGFTEENWTAIGSLLPNLNMETFVLDGFGGEQIGEETFSRISVELVKGIKSNKSLTRARISFGCRLHLMIMCEKELMIASALEEVCLRNTVSKFCAELRLHRKKTLLRLVPSVLMIIEETCERLNIASATPKLRDSVVFAAMTANLDNAVTNGPLP